MRVLVAQLNPTIGAFESNLEKILGALKEARARACSLVVFSELSLCGYPPEDLLLLKPFLEACEEALQKIVQASQDLAIIVGCIRPSRAGSDKPLHNSAAVIHDGQLLGYQDKSLLPTYDVFDEHRYFEPAKESRIFEIRGKRVGVTICEDIWKAQDPIVFADYVCDPLAFFADQKPDLLINLSASPYSYNKIAIRHQVAVRTAQKVRCPIVLCNQIGGNDSLIFDGTSVVLDPHGGLIAQGESFRECFLTVDIDALPPTQSLRHYPIADLHHALVLGVKDYFQKSHFDRALLGFSGGIDSSLVACIACAALGPENVLGISMPSRYSSEGSVTDAKALADNLGVKLVSIPIEEPFNAYLSLLKIFFEGKPADITEENLQARIRGMILMALSNKHGHIVLSTGNKSETALGYSTLYGDLCGGLSVIADVTKTQVYALCRWINGQVSLIPEAILEKAPSAELSPGQKDSDSLPDYAIVDAILEAYVEKHCSTSQIAEQIGQPLQLVEEIIKRIHRAEYKRRQSPPGLRVTEKAFTKGRCFPIVQRWCY